MRKKIIRIIVLSLALVCFAGFTPKGSKYFFMTISNPQVNKIEVSFFDKQHKKLLGKDEKAKLVKLLKIIKKDDMRSYSPSKMELINNLTITISLKPIGSIVVVPMNSSSYAESFIYRYGNKYYITYQPALRRLLERIKQEYLQNLYPQNILFSNCKINAGQISKIYLSSRLINKTLLSPKQVNEIVNILNHSKKRYSLLGFVASAGGLPGLSLDIYTNKKYKITIYPYDIGYSMYTAIGMISDIWSTNTFFNSLGQDVENINNSLRFKVMKNMIAHSLNNYINYTQKITGEIRGLDISEDKKSQLLSLLKDHEELSIDATKKQLNTYFENVAKLDNQGRYFDIYYNNCDSYLSSQTKKLEEFEREYIKGNTQIDTTGSAIN